MSLENSPVSETGTRRAIDITGKSNRYLVRKLTQGKVSPIKRKQVEKWNVEPSWFVAATQIDLLDKDEPIVKGEIVKKIASYRHQDILKKRLNPQRFIDYPYVKGLIRDCNLICHYCKEDSLILYETRRDMSQWTVDRIDNSIGHDVDNIVISCLKCNLQRRSQNADKFLQTKQLVITREDHEDGVTDNE